MLVHKFLLFLVAFYNKQQIISKELIECLNLSAVDRHTSTLFVKGSSLYYEVTRHFEGKNQSIFLVKWRCELFGINFMISQLHMAEGCHRPQRVRLLLDSEARETLIECDP